MDLQSLLQFVLVQIFTAIGIWSGIKVEIKSIHIMMAANKEAAEKEIAATHMAIDAAHRRLDRIVESQSQFARRKD